MLNLALYHSRAEFSFNTVFSRDILTLQQPCFRLSSCYLKGCCQHSLLLVNSTNFNVKVELSAKDLCSCEKICWEQQFHSNVFISLWNVAFLNASAMGPLSYSKGIQHGAMSSNTGVINNDNYGWIPFRWISSRTPILCMLLWITGTLKWNCGNVYFTHFIHLFIRDNTH